jgi:hypothetical protein
MMTSSLAETKWANPHLHITVLSLETGAGNTGSNAGQFPIEFDAKNSRK